MITLQSAAQTAAAVIKTRETRDENTMSFLNNDVRHAIDSATNKGLSGCSVVSARTIDVTKAITALVRLGYIVATLPTTSKDTAEGMGTSFVISWYDESGVELKRVNES